MVSLTCEVTCVLVAQLCPTLCNPKGCSVPGSSIRGILQVRILEWVPIPFSKGSFQPKDRTHLSQISGRFSTIWATREAHLNEKWKWSHSVVSDSSRPHGPTPWTPLCMRFFQARVWNGLPFPSPGDLSDPGIEPGSPTLQADTLRLSHQSLRPTYVWHLKKEKNPTEAQPSALWQPRGVGWEGGSRGRRHVRAHGWFMLLYCRNQCNIVKQLSSN